MVSTVLEMAKRRLVRNLDVARVLEIPQKEAERLMKGLMIKGFLRKEDHGGEVYFTGVVSNS